MEKPIEIPKPEPLSIGEAIKRLDDIAELLGDAYSLLTGYEWRQLAEDLPFKTSLTGSCEHALEAYTGAGLARRRLEELSDGKK